MAMAMTTSQVSNVHGNGCNNVHGAEQSHGHDDGYSNGHGNGHSNKHSNGHSNSQSNSHNNALKRDSLLPSPLTTLLPNLSTAEQKSLPYPPTAYPGARDVPIRFGLAGLGKFDGVPGTDNGCTMRVYEWGPEDTANRIVLVHGDSTPCFPIWKLLAPELAQRGCRVICFDLFGRGYTATPLRPHSMTLYTSQLYDVISSSPQAAKWLATGFDIIGFSLGSAIAMSFVATYPSLVRRVCLLAPGGLLRVLPDGYMALQTAMREADETGIEIGEDELRRLVGVCQGIEQQTRPDSAHAEIPAQGETSVSNGSQQRIEITLRKGGGKDIVSEVSGVNEDMHDGSNDEKEDDDLASLSSRVLAWQLNFHKGHISSFSSTLREKPYLNQREVWKLALRTLLLSPHDFIQSPAQVQPPCSGRDLHRDADKSIEQTPIEQRRSDGRALRGGSRTEGLDFSARSAGSGRFIVICGSNDEIVSAAHMREDVEDILNDVVAAGRCPERTGSGHLEYVFKTVPGGHGFPLDKVCVRSVLDVLAREWGIQGDWQ